MKLTGVRLKANKKWVVLHATGWLAVNLLKGFCESDGGDGLQGKLLTACKRDHIWLKITLK